MTTNVADLTILANVKQWLDVSGLPIAAITKANPAQVTLATAPSTPLLSGVVYSLAGINGMVELNGTNYPITTVDPRSFTIPVDSTGFTTYSSGGVVGVSDPLLQRLITAASVYVQSWTNRVFRCLDYTETRNGQGGPSLAFFNYPVVSVSAVTVDGVSIPARAPLGPSQNAGSGAGFTFNDLAIYLSSFVFCRGFQNVALAYAAGYQIADEAQTIPGSPGPYTLTTLGQWSAGDRGVTYADDGISLAAVPSAPGPGEYSVAGSVYTFNAADAGAAVLLTYSAIPYDIEQATIDAIGDWFVYRSRIGRTSEAIEGQSISFTNTGLPARSQSVLQQYRKYSIAT